MKLLKDILYKVSIQSVVGNTNVGINRSSSIQIK